MKTSTIWAIVIILVIVIGGVWWFEASQNSAQPMSDMPATTDQSPMIPSPNATTTSTSQASSVSISNFAFSPTSLTVKKGTTVTWTNNDSVPHTVTGDNGGPSSGSISSGTSYSYTFTTTGTFAYHCTIHPSMHGTVVVTE